MKKILAIIVALATVLSIATGCSKLTDIQEGREDRVHGTFHNTVPHRSGFR